MTPEVYAHNGPVRCLAMSPDIRWIASGGADRVVRMWDRATGALLREFVGHTGGVNSVSISADGRLMLTASGDKELRLWDIATGQCLKTFKGHSWHVVSCCLSRCGSLAVSGSGDSTVRIWDIQTGRELRALSGHTDFVLSVGLSDDNRCILSGGGDGDLLLWDSATGQCLRRIKAHEGYVAHIASDPDCRVALVCGSASVWDTSTGCRLAELPHTERIIIGCVVADGSRVMTGDADGCIQVWEAGSGRCLSSIETRVGSLRSLIATPDGNICLAGDTVGHLTLLDIRTGATVMAFGDKTPPGRGDVATASMPDMQVRPERHDDPNMRGTAMPLDIPPRGDFATAAMPVIPVRDTAAQMPQIPSQQDLGEILSTGRGMADKAGEAPRDSVDCAVFAPPSALVGRNLLVQVYAHIPEKAQEAQSMAREFDEEARRRGVTSLGTAIRRGAKLTFEMSLGTLMVDEPVQELVWQGNTSNVAFCASIPQDHAPGALVGKILISQESIPIGRLLFKLEVAAADSLRHTGDTRPRPCGTATRYTRAFISYSSKDRPEVLRRVQMLPAVGIHYFQDVMDLEPGDRWAKELFRHIDESDVMFLFWSSAARASDGVRKEWKYALEKKGDDFIRPVIIEGPPHPAPPQELEHLHFDDKVLYFIR